MKPIEISIEISKEDIHKLVEELFDEFFTWCNDCNEYYMATKFIHGQEFDICPQGHVIRKA